MADHLLNLDYTSLTTHVPLQHRSQCPEVKRMIQLSQHKVSMKQKCKPKGSTGSARIVLCWVWGTRREYSSPWQLRFRVTWRQEQNNSNYSVWLQITETARDTCIWNFDTTKRKGLPNNPIGLRHLKSLKLFNLFYKSPALLLEIQWSCTHTWTLQASFIIVGLHFSSDSEVVSLEVGFGKYLIIGLLVILQ